MYIENTHENQQKSPPVSHTEHILKGGLAHEPDVLPAFIHREAIQDCAVNIVGWASILVCAAERSPAAEQLGLLRKMRETLLLAIDETKALAALEQGETNEPL